MKQKFFDSAVAVALTAPGIGKDSKFRHGAVLVRKNRIQTVGQNSYKTHPYSARYSEYPFTHAEQHAIYRQGLDNCQGMDIYVVRVNRKGKVRSSKPCSTCQQIAKDAGINKICYSTPEGDYAYLDIEKNN